MGWDHAGKVTGAENVDVAVTAGNREPCDKKVIRKDRMRLVKILFHMLAAMVLCVALLLLSTCIPRGMIQKQSENSAKYFAERAPFAILIGDYVNAMQDNYSDTVLCDIAYFIDPAHPFESVIRARYAHNENEEAYAS